MTAFGAVLAALQVAGRPFTGHLHLTTLQRLPCPTEKDGNKGWLLSSDVRCEQVRAAPIFCLTTDDRQSLGRDYFARGSADIGQRELRA